MELKKSHVFDAPIDQVWAMFCDEAAHIAKFDSMGHAKIEVKESEITPDSARIVVSREVTIDLPSIAKKVLQPTNNVVSTDVWRRDADGTCTGSFSAETKGAPVSIKGTTHLVAKGDGQTTYTIETDVRVNVPLIGKKVEGFMRGMVEDQLDQEFRCGDAWLAKG